MESNHFSFWFVHCSFSSTFWLARITLVLVWLLVLTYYHSFIFEWFSFECRKNNWFFYGSWSADVLRLVTRSSHVRGEERVTSLPIGSERKTQSWFARRRSPALCVRNVSLPQVFIGSLNCLCSLWLAGAITWILIWQCHSIERKVLLRTFAPIATAHL